MGWASGAWASGAWAGTAWAEQDAPIEVPDVVGDSQAAGTATLEGDGFVVSVATAYSPSVAAGDIISQSPIGGSFANEGSTVTITVSLGPEPVADEPVGGHYWPDEKKRKKPRDFRAERDEQILQERLRLRETLERAAGLIEEAASSPAEQVAEVKAAVAEIASHIEAPHKNDQPAFDAVAMQKRVDALIAKTVDDLIVQLTGVLTELIQEIQEDA